MNIFSSNDGTITLQNLTDLVNGVITPVTGATVAFTLYDAAAVAVLSGVSMAYVAGTASDYAGAILSSFNPDLTVHQNPFSLVITATFSGKTATFTRQNVTVKIRTI